MVYSFSSSFLSFCWISSMAKLFNFLLVASSIFRIVLEGVISFLPLKIMLLLSEVQLSYVRLLLWDFCIRNNELPNVPIYPLCLFCICICLFLKLRPCYSRKAHSWAHKEIPHSFLWKIQKPFLYIIPYFFLFVNDKLVNTSDNFLWILADFACRICIGFVARFAIKKWE